MKRPALLTFATLVCLLCRGTEAPAEEAPKASASAASAASAAPAASAASAASAAPAAEAPPAVEGKSFAEAPPGAEKSKAPTPEEWKTAPWVALTRSAALCRAYRVREWLKIHCDGFPAAGVSLLAGQNEGVMVYVDQTSEAGNEVMKKPRPAEVIFPVRRGDGRVLQIAQFGEGYDGPLGWNVAFTVSEQWVDGEAGPIITVL
jgi:hypothetical protein